MNEGVLNDSMCEHGNPRTLCSMCEAIESDYAAWLHNRGEKDRRIAALTAELAAARAERDQLREALASVEWGGEYYSCPSCERYEDDGHAPDCPVGRVMAMGGA